MYLDRSIFPASTVAECTVEKEFCALEDRVAKILQKIEAANHRGDAGFSLPRHEKDELRRFLFILLYRNRTLERRFVKSRSDYDADDRYNMLTYMQERGIEDPKTVWLNNLLAFLRVELDPAGSWVKEITEKVYLPDAMWFFMHLQSTFLSFCCPSDIPGSNDEFMLTQNAYSIFEGPNGETEWMDWHVFAPISPNLMIVMRKNLPQNWNAIREEFLRLEQLGKRKSAAGLDRSKPLSPSILTDLPLQPPRVRYSRSPGHDKTVNYCKDDEFCFRFVTLATKHLQLLNVIFFEEAITTSGIVFSDHQKFKHSLENYLASDPMQFKRTYSDNQLLKDHIPLPPSLRTNAWKSANVEGYLKLLEATAADLGSDVKARYFDLNLFKYMDGVSAEFIRRYSILGGDGVTIFYDLSQANAITNLVTRVDTLIRNQSQSFKSQVRDERTKMITQLPVRRIWLHVRQLRDRVKNKSTRKTEDELIECTTSQADGIEDAMIDAYHVFDASRFPELMYTRFMGSM